MSIDLGNTPTPPNANPTTEQALQIRTAIGAVEQSPNDTIMYVRKQLAYQSIGVVQILTSMSMAERHLLDVLPAYWGPSSDAYVMTVNAGIELQSYALYNCQSLQQLEIYDCVIPIYFCTSNPQLTDVYIYACPSIGDFAFADNPAITSAYLDTQYIYNGAFGYLSALSNLTLANVVEIGVDAFRATAITYVEIPPSCIQIGAGAFADCGAIYELILNEGLQTIGDYAFQAVSGISNLTIPSTVTSIGSGAFEFNALTYLRVNSSAPPSIGTGVFDSGTLTGVSVPNTPEWAAAGGSWAGLTITIDP